MPRTYQMDRRQLTLAALSGALLSTLSFGVAAQSFPSKPVRLIVPFPPGGAVDVYARIIQVPLATELGQPVIVENRAGASGMIGADFVAKSPPDGYVLLVGNVATLAMNSAIYSKMAYDPIKDLTPIFHTVQVNYVLVVHPSVPVRTTAELISYAKKNPEKLAYGSSGAGSAQHMAAELFKGQTNTSMVHAPYKGTGALVNDLLAGHVQLAFADMASMMPQVKAGRLRALGVGGLKRSDEYPELPTISESAQLPGYEAVAWQGLAGPAGLPPQITRRFNEALARVHASPSLKEKLATAGLTSVGSTPEGFGQYIRAEVVKWTKVARDNGISAE